MKMLLSVSSFCSCLLPAIAANHTHHSRAGCIAAGHHHPFLCAPNVRIGLEEALSEPIIQAVENGRADIGILADNVSAEGLYKLPYRDDRLVLLVPVGHELANERSVSFADTLGFDYVALNQGSCCCAESPMSP
nr:LysR substrate-binding domain-containing protein [Pseudomonas sp. QTF5]